MVHTRLLHSAKLASFRDAAVRYWRLQMVWKDVCTNAWWVPLDLEFMQNESRTMANAYSQQRRIFGALQTS